MKYLESFSKQQFFVFDMKSIESSINFSRLQFFQQQIAINSKQFFRYMNYFQIANNNSFVLNFTSFASFELMRTHISFSLAFDYNVFARVMHEIMQNLFSIFILVINVISFSFLNMIISFFISRFEKLFDIIKHDENRDCLNV